MVDGQYNRRMVRSDPRDSHHLREGKALVPLSGDKEAVELSQGGIILHVGPRKLLIAEREIQYFQFVKEIREQGHHTATPASTPPFLRVLGQVKVSAHNPQPTAVPLEIGKFPIKICLPVPSGRAVDVGDKEGGTGGDMLQQNSERVITQDSPIAGEHFRAPAGNQTPGGPRRFDE